MEEAGWRIESNALGGAQEDKRNHELISGIRTEIDSLDQEMSRLIAQRLNLARKLKKAKAGLGLPVLDSERESEVLDKVTAPLADPGLAQAVRAIYEAIMSQSRKLQTEEIAVPAAVRRAQDELKRRPLYFPRVLIVGLGLIGGALARQIKTTLPQTVVVGVDRPEILDEALRQGIIDAGETDLVEAQKKTQLIILAANPDQNLALLEQLGPVLKRRQLVIDVTSTKSRICRLAEKLNLHGADFIGGHPFFGSEKSGLAGSLELNTEGKLFCLVPTVRSSEISLRRLSRWLTTLKFKVETTDATTHDITAARLSHLVQLLAVTLGAELAEGCTGEELARALKLSGPSFAQTARLMSSPAQLWTEIVAQNQAAIVEALNGFDKRLKVLKKAIAAGDGKAVERLFAAAATIPPAVPH